MIKSKVINDDCLKFIRRTRKKSFSPNLTFLDPPFNQGKEYRETVDDLPEEQYWKMMKQICKLVFNRTVDGGSIYFMQREKNTKLVMETLEEAGWNYQNLIIWKKKTSAVPQNYKYSLSYQIIAYAIKGNSAKTFNKLRINPPRLITEKYERPDGMYVTDVWDDIRELTSGYFAGDEAIRNENGERFHKQQSPIALLLRIILSSSNVEDLIFDPFAGTGTTLVVSKQLNRRYIGVEIDPINAEEIKRRLAVPRVSDNIERYRKDYAFTKNLDKIWPTKIKPIDSPTYSGK